MKTLQLPFLFALVGSLCAAESAPRIGILSDAGARKEADLLLVELQKARCELVERDEIGKVLGEQALQSALSREGCRRVGRLLRADGLVLLSSGANKTTAVRMVAVEPGVIVWLAQSANGDRWAGDIADTLASYLPKLTVRADAAVPVTLLRVRPAFGMARAIRLADDCSQLLTARLVREPRLFVLERENLARMEEESRWSGQETTFWTGSRLVEGTVGFDLVRSNSVTLALVVRPPAGDAAAARPIALEGDGGMLADLVERAAIRVVEALGARPAAVWDRQAEGQRLIGLAPHLENPEQQKAALSTAMALGCRDSKTANAYRIALRAVAFRDARRFSGLDIHLASGDGLRKQGEDFLELIRFHNDYQPPEGFRGDGERGWLFTYFPPLMDMKGFLDVLLSTKRADELAGVIREIRAECRRTAARMVAIDPHFQLYGQGHIVPTTARYWSETAREILDVYRRLALPPKTNAVYYAIGGSTGSWFMERKMAEPLLPGPRTESDGERERLWQEFMAELRSSDRPDLRIHFATERAQRPDLVAAERLAARRQLQAVIAECRPHFLAMPRHIGFASTWSVAYPGVVPGLAAAELKADAQHAVETFVATTPQNTLRPGEAEALIRPYLTLLTEEQAETVFRKTREFVSPCAGIPNCSYQGEVDVFAIQTWLGQKFPEVLDDAYRAEVARRQGLARIPDHAVRVTGSIRFPAYRGLNPPPVEFSQWRGGDLWLCWGNEWLRVDVAQGSHTALPLPSELGDACETAHFSRVMMTDDLLIYWKRLFSGPPESMESHLAFHPIDGGEWRTARLPFEIRQLAQIGRKLYFTTAVPQIVVYQGEGLVEFDTQTLASRTLRAPGTWPAERVGKSAPVAFEHLAFGDGVRDGALIGHVGRVFYGWDPAANQVRLLAPQPKPAPPSAVDTNSHAFGFDLCRNIAYGWIELKGTPAGHHELHVTPEGSRQPVAVPVLFPAIPEPVHPRLLPPGVLPTGGRPRPAYLPDVGGAAMAGTTALFVPFGGRRALHVVPYAEIRKWLDASPPAADTARPPQSARP